LSPAGKENADEMFKPTFKCSKQPYYKTRHSASGVKIKLQVRLDYYVGSEIQKEWKWYETWNAEDLEKPMRLDLKRFYSFSVRSVLNKTKQHVLSTQKITSGKLAEHTWFLKTQLEYQGKVLSEGHSLSRSF